MSAILYAAKSTVDKKGSIGTQLEDGRAIAEANGWPILAERHDEDASAYSSNRGGGLAEAMALCEANPGSKLIVQHSDRLARGDGQDAKHLGDYVAWAAKHRVTLVSAQDPWAFADYGNPHIARLMGDIAGMRNNEDSKRKSEAVKDGMARRAARRQPNGGPAGFGYRWEAFIDDGEPCKRRVIDDAQAPIVRRIFGEFVAGRSQNQITRDLNMERVPTATGSGKWYQATVRNILRCPLYVGRFTFHGEIIDTDELKPIVDLETWSKAQAMLAPSTGKRGQLPAGSHLFTKGLLQCSCGAPMCPVTKPTRTGGTYEVYSCLARRTHGVDHCPQEPVKRADVDAATFDYFRRVALDVAATREAIAKGQTVKLAEIDALRAQASRDLAKAEVRLSKVRRDYMDGDLDAADWREFRDELTAEIDAAKAQIAQLDARREALATEADEYATEEELIAELTKIRDLIAGDAKDGASKGADALRAALRRLFVRFDLIPFDEAIALAHGDESDQRVAVGRGYWLMPRVRPEAMASRFVNRPERVALDGLERDADKITYGRVGRVGEDGLSDFEVSGLGR